ncbi:MAG: hypothetical protein DYG98_11940 [Haliscomenobacteraceae bacterium CHB4]|nr:hypothetical protein [Saprospiraceae bacterium]MCE7923760.1 hypothetical protein [Haliscomenobacteraceae bacterium CHB4]
MRNRLTLLALLPAFCAGAQISDGGKPLALLPENQSLLSGKMPAAVALPALDVQQVREEDARTPGQNRFAAPVAADISPDNAGAWTDLPNGDRVWQCALQSPGALGLVLLFDQFHLPPGSRFFAYSPDGKIIKGAYTDRSCIPSGKFTVGVLPGETVRLEYYEPANVKGQAQIHLNRADIAYDPAGLLDFGDALPCNINVNCPTGAAWQTEKKGVARILMIFSNGAGWCSGTLVANTSGTAEPYFLSAHHCQLIGQNPDFDQWVFDFDYEAAGCDNPANEPAAKSALGCERIAFRQETDFMLLKLNPLPGNYGLYFNGWTRDSTPAAYTTFIHHPQGDIKKITVDSGAAVIHPLALNWSGIFGISPPRSHWKTVPDYGIFQPGSSGSPLFDPNRRIVGQLHGGSVNQMNPCLNNVPYWGRFDLSWDQGIDPQHRLREWLDPNNLNPATQNGYPQPTPQLFSVSGNVQTHWGQPMPNVKMTITGGASATVYTDSAGNYTFTNIPVGGNYTVAASLDTNDLNGVSTFDLVLMSKHILGLEPLDSPWKIIASDANKSNSVTTFDIVEIRKLILGIYTVYPNNTSWRFFPLAASFPDPGQPFSGNLPPEVISILNLQGDYTGGNFRGVKTGDANNTALPGQ